jgi:hypothetical protein
MTINKRIIEEYLNREIEPLTWIKELSEEELDHELSYIKPPIKLSVPLRKEQKACLLMGLADPGLAFLLDLGLGKGHPVGTKILSPKGWVNIEYLRVGDQIIGSSGWPVNVTGVYPKGKLPTYRVEFTDKSSVVTDGEHLWSVLTDKDKRSGKPPRIKTTQELQESLESGWKYFSIPMVKPIQFPKQDLPIPPYIIGVLLGDGSLSYQSNANCFTPGDELVPEEVKKELPDGYSLSISKDKTGYRIISKGRGLYGPNNILNSMIRMGLSGIKSQERFIPESYLFSSVEDRISLLQGLMDTDGEYREKDGHTCFSSSSQKLVEQVQFLVESLGGSAKIRVKKNVFYTYKGERKRGLPSHSVTINLPPEICPLRAFAYKWTPKTKYLPNRTASKITEEGEAEVICISVDAKDKLYVTEHCIVTHNTAISLELLSYFYKNGFMRTAFVFASSDELIEGWEDEIKHWGFDIPYLLLRNSPSKKKWEALEKFEGGLIIGTYVGISAMVASIEEVVTKKGTKRKRVINTKLVNKITADVDACVFDQSTKISRADSLSAKVCFRFAKKAQINYALAGRAFGRDPILLYNQFRLVDKGRAFGNSIGLFREAFYRKEHAVWDKWVLRKRREPTLSHFCTASSLRYGAAECLQLPERVHIVKHCSLPDDTWYYYEPLKEELLKHKGNYREIKNMFMKMRQISSGFVGFKDDETGDRAQIEFEENPKLDLLLEVVEQLPPDKKMIVFHEFTWSGEKICELLTKHKIKHGWLRGGTKDWTQIKDAYNSDDDFRVLVANWKKGSMGLNLQNGNYMVFYESPVGAIDRSESEGRQRRSGQKHTCFVIDLVMKDTVDENILDMHTEGKLTWDRIIENPQLVKSRRK